MNIKNLNDKVTVSGQINISDIQELKRLGVNTIVCNRPDGEEPDQTTFEQIRTGANLLRIDAVHLPFVNDDMTLQDIDQLANLMKTSERLHLYCRSGARSSTLWALAGMKLGYHEESIIDQVTSAGYKLDAEKLSSLVQAKVEEGSSEEPLNSLRKQRMEHFDVVIVGGGSGGLSMCASLLKRNKKLKIAVIEPRHHLFYQPGWTMVGGGVFSADVTRKHVKNYVPKGVIWIQNSVASFSPNRHLVQLDNDNHVHYQQLVIAPGLELNWDGVEGLRETLGRNGVTSNYRFDLAPYTWELVQGLKSGKAIFTQPPMPIKCAGAPQKAMYLSADHWWDNDVLKNIDVNFYSAGDAIFGVKAYVPALNEYLKKYSVDTHFEHTLIKVDGEKRTAYFKTNDSDGNESIVESHFDMLHVCPPQRAPQFVRDSVLSDDSGWLNVDQATLVHKDYHNIWGVGDVINAPNAKTLAAVRKQVPVVAENLIKALDGKAPNAAYSGYGSCPLTVERGKIVLAEFVYGGKHSPTFPNWLNDGTRPTRFAWILKTHILPWLYWEKMLRGIEWFTKPLEIKK